MQRSLEGKIALITGGTAGIGRACAEKFCDQGATCIIFGTNEARGQEVQAQLAPNCTFYKVNVANKGEVEKAVQDILNTHGRVDILINNAGITSDQLLMKMTEQDWDDVMAINVKSCYNLCQTLARPMMKAREGKMINMSSVVGITGNAGQANYAASKAAIIGFTKALAKELAPRNIQVNSIAPGFIETNMTHAMAQAAKEKAISQIPLGKMGTPEDIANGALFLASPMASYITGQVLVIDGGMII